MAIKTKEKPQTSEPPQSFPAVVVEKKEATISQAGGKYQYPLEMAAKAAHQNPRNERAILDGALDELSLSPKLAVESYYSIPRKKWDKDKGTFEIIKIEGPSIGAAMSLARRWGNCINGNHVREELDDRISCEGVFIDAQTNTWTLRTITAEKFYTDRKTGLKRPLAQDMLLNAIQAAQSKAVRNAVLSTLPKWLTRAYFEEAKRIAGGGDLRGGQKAEMTPEECVDWLIKHFPALGVTPEMYAKYVKENLADMNTIEQIGEMRGIYNAIKDKQTTVEEIWPKPAGTQNDKAAGAGPVTGEGLFPGDTGSI